jgi:hypothetical protein
VKQCKVSAFGGYGPNPYIYLNTNPTNSIKVSGGNAAREALLAVASSSAVVCHYDLTKFVLPPQFELQ